MGSRQGSNAFQEMVDDDRQKKKNEELANQIFGRSKSNQNVRKPQKDTRSLSLASRMGVTKRASSTSVPTQRNSLNPPTRPNSTTPSNRNGRDYTARNNRIANEIDSGNANVTSRNNSFANNNNNNNTRNTNPPNNNDRRSRQNGPGLSIRGSAGPFTVQLSNFAPGTTEADIESAMQSDMHDADGKDCLQSCRLTSTKPTVVAEMVITERKVADRIVNKFNEMRADGLVLKVKIVRTGAVPSVNGTDDAKTEEPVVEDVEMEQPEHRAYEHEREAADRDRRERERDRDFGRRDERRGEREERRDDRRERDRERERERDRERDSQREREYERRDAPQQLQQQPVYDNRPSGPQQQYGGYERPYGSGFRYGSGRGYGSSRSGYGGRGGGYSRYSR